MARRNAFGQITVSNKSGEKLVLTFVDYETFFDVRQTLEHSGGNVESFWGYSVVKTSKDALDMIAAFDGVLSNG